MRVVGAERDRDLVRRVAYDVEDQLDQLGVGPARVQLGGEALGPHRRLPHHRVDEPERDLVPLVERRVLEVVDLVEEPLVTAGAHRVHVAQ